MRHGCCVALVAAHCEVGSAASSRRGPGARHGAVRRAAAPRDEVLARLTEGARRRGRRVRPERLGRPTRAARPGWTGTSSVRARWRPLGTIASGAMANLIHRAACVALKEGRRLVLVPARDAALDHPARGPAAPCGAPAPSLLFAAPGFYHGAETIDDLVDFVVAPRARPARSRERAHPAVGRVSTESRSAAAGRRPARCSTASRRSTTLMNRVMTAGLDRRWRRADRRARSSGPATACSTPAAAPAISPSPRARARAAQVTGLDFSERMLERARRKSSPGRLGARRPARAPLRGGVVRRGHGRLRRPQRRRSRARRSPSCGACCVPGGRLAVLEITRRAACSRPSTGSGSTGLVPLLGRVLPGGSAYTYLPASVRRFPGPDELARRCTRRASRDVRYRLLAGGIVALPHSGGRA